MATQSFLRILQLLDRFGVEYVVVGGVAAVLQGAPVTTFDIDALVKVDAGNADRLLGVLKVLEARYREHDTLAPTRDDLLAGGQERKTLGRDKDLAVVRILEAVLRRRR